MSARTEVLTAIIRKTIEPTSLEIGLPDPAAALSSRQGRLHLPNITRDDAVKPRLVRPRSQSSRDGRSCSLFTMCKITSGAWRSARELFDGQTSKPKTGDLVEPDGSGGARRDRTDDLMLAKHALSQLSYGPSFR